MYSYSGFIKRLSVSHPSFLHSSMPAPFSNQSLDKASKRILDGRKRFTGHSENLIVEQAKVCLVDYP